jgi:hypothetical protein
MADIIFDNVNKITVWGKSLSRRRGGFASR